MQKPTPRFCSVLYEHIPDGQIDDDSDQQGHNGNASAYVSDQLKLEWIVSILIHVNNQGKVGQVRTVHCYHVFFVGFNTPTSVCHPATSISYNKQ